MGKKEVSVTEIEAELRLTASSAQLQKPHDINTAGGPGGKWPHSVAVTKYLQWAIDLQQS